MIQTIGNVIINEKFYSGNDLYSDGQIEDELLHIVKQYKEKDFNRIIEERKMWPILYHLSHIRSNIISWLPISLEESVLEIGSGCGAITGQLALMSKSVTCVELSKKRSLINAYRNNYKNITILLGNYQELSDSIEIKYDYITLIGVLEYSELYIESDDAYITLLKNLKKHLTPQGKIIIAIENKYGLKYWAGCQEDHIGGFFSGIEGYSGFDKIRTFSKKELEKILNQSGLHQYQFYYPYPDYKFPSCIYSDNYLPKKGELNFNFCNFDRERMNLFDETKVFNELLKEDSFSFFSNSYLIIAENGDK